MSSTVFFKVTDAEGLPAAVDVSSAEFQTAFVAAVQESTTLMTSGEYSCKWRKFCHTRLWNLLKVCLA